MNLNSMKLLKSSYWPYFLIILSGLLFIPFLGQVHLFDWDEINFAEAAREMLVTKNYLTVQIDFIPFWEKPPLFIWFQVLSMKFFGVNEFAARFPNAICGIFTVYSLFLIGQKMKDKLFANIWILCYVGSFLPFFYFKSGIIDPWFNLFIFLSIYQLINYTDQYSLSFKSRSAILAGIFLGLAILTKGPVAIIIVGLTGFIYLVINKFKIPFRIQDILLFLSALILSGGSWFIAQIMDGQASTVWKFILYQIRLFTTEDAGHGHFFLYHFIVLFIGVFPASIFAIKGFSRKNEERNTLFFHSKTWMIILFWVVLLLFTIVRTKIVHYSSMCYFPLTYIAASYIYSYLQQSKPIPGWIKFLIVGLSGLWAIITIFLSFFDQIKPFIFRNITIKDEFAMECMKANGHWLGFEFIVGLILLAGTIFFIYHRNKQWMWVGLFLTTFSFSYFSMLLYVPKIERYSQNSFIRFLQSKKGCNCYINPVDFKSYAHLFYANKQPGTDLKHWTNEHILSSPDIDKSAFFIIKSNHKEDYIGRYPDLKFLYEENGFVFAIKEPRTKKQK
jgi:4-amino-4-deoxy-L-arabinose transferase-like glycosyltransferase